MQSHHSLTIGWLFISYIIYKLAARIFHSYRNAAKAREWECADAPLQKNCLPLGIDQIRRSLKADKESKFPLLTEQRCVDVGVTVGLGRPAYTFKWSALGATGFTTHEPENIKFILAKGFNDFDLGHVRRGNFFPLLGNGIFTQDGKGWEHSRAMMRPSFAREQVADLNLEEKHVQNMMQALPVNSDGWTDEVDVQVLFFRLTLDSATEFLFGESVDSQLSELPTRTDHPQGSQSEQSEQIFAQSFDVAQRGLATRSRYGDLYWLCNPKFFREACDDCHDFIDHFVRLALSDQLRTTQQLKELSSPGLSSLAINGIKGKYIFLEALAAETQDPIELRSQLLHILLAGRDTTASLLSWLFLLLSRKPDYYLKLRNQIIKDFGTYEECDPSSITFSKLKSCTFLQHCTSETLRLYPVVPVNSRRSNKDTYLPTGGGPDGTSKIFIPANTPVDYSVYVMHRRKDLWGPDADVFRPERWEGNGAKVGWEFLPFNGGPRICIGQQFALTEANYVTVRLLQRFHVMEVGRGEGEGEGEEEEVRFGLTLTMAPKGGGRMRLREGRG